MLCLFFMKRHGCRSCPLCRAHIEIKNPLTEPNDAGIEAAVRAAIKAATGSEELYEAQLFNNQITLDKLLEQRITELPIFAMGPGTSVGVRNFDIILVYFHHGSTPAGSGSRRGGEGGDNIARPSQKAGTRNPYWTSHPNHPNHPNHPGRASCWR